MDEQNVRMCPPTNLDHKPFGSMFKVLREDNNFDYYIQLSENENEPQWERMGAMLETAYRSRFNDSLFIAGLLKEYKKNK